MNNKLFSVVAAVAAVMFAYAPFMILAAPYESTMGLVQKIFYFHAACGMAMFLAAFVSGIGSAMFLFTKKPSADRMAVAGAELTVGVVEIVDLDGWHVSGKPPGCCEPRSSRHSKPRGAGTRSGRVA